MRILLVDDSPVILDLLAESLRLHGHDSAEASSAAMALPMLPYMDAAIVDGLNGQGMRVLSACEARGLPAVLYSGNEETVVLAQRLGFTAVLKPASIKELLAALGQAAGAK